MTTTITQGRTERETAAVDGGRVLRYAAAAALVTGPLLWSAGMFTSPPQASMADVDYVASLARDVTRTEVSALFLHYGNLFIALGVLAATSLVRGRRGALMVPVGAILTAIGCADVSGMLPSDWWNAAIGTALPVDQAAEIFGSFKHSHLLWIWDGTELFSLVGSLVLLAGLGRAGVVGWSTPALLVIGAAMLMAIPVSMMWLTAIAVLVGFSPFAFVGLRLVQRLRVERG